VTVDRINPSQVISTAAKVFDVDINTCKVDDLQFSSEYTLQITNGYGLSKRDFNAMLMYFEVDFPQPQAKPQ
jgi:hypothetical protein